MQYLIWLGVFCGAKALCAIRRKLFRHIAPDTSSEVRRLDQGAAWAPHVLLLFVLQAARPGHPALCCDAHTRLMQTLQRMSS